MSPGGGVAINGFSTKSTFRFTRILSLLMKLEYEVKQFFAIRYVSIIKQFPEVIDLKFHFSTFSKPLLMFDTRLEYKLILDWNEKTIYPIDIGMERIKIDLKRLPYLTTISRPPQIYNF